MTIPYCVAIDTETTGLNPWRGHRMFAAAACFSAGRQLMWRDSFDGLADILKDPNIDKVFHNAKFDLRMLEFAGFEVRGRVWDTMILCHLIDGRDRGKGLSLDNTAKKYLPSDFRKITTPINEWFASHGPKRGNKDFSRLPHDLLRQRVVGDADLTLRLFKRLYPTVASIFPRLLDQEHRLLPIVKQMEDRGISVDLDEIDNQINHFGKIVDDAVEFCEGVLGWDYFNIDSRAHQIALLKEAHLYDRLEERTPPSKTFPQGQPKMDDWNLRTLHHPVSHMLILGKAAKKMRNTFLMQVQECAIDGVVHPSFNQLGTTTGRFSCSNPNLQNIPIEGDRRTAYTEDEATEAFEMTETEYAPHLKRMFRCRPGYVHIHSDKVQAEVVALAHYTNERTMIEIFERGESVHDGLCRLLYGEWTKGLKTRTKAVVFGYQYGAGLATIAKKIGQGCTVREARNTRDRLARLLPSLPRWRNLLNSQIHNRGYIETVHGRRHYLAPRNAYKAVNRMCQGTVGDEVKACMVNIGEELDRRGIDGRIILNVHDDVVTEVAIPDLAEAGPLIYKLMNTPSVDFRLPLRADCNITSTRWSDTKSVEDPTDPNSFFKAANLDPPRRRQRRRLQPIRRSS